SPTGGAPVLHEPMSVQTAEHWVFLGGAPYNAARPFSVKRIGPASGMVHASLTDFLKDMSTQSVARYVIARAATLPPPSPGAPPAIPATGVSILGAGGYRVYQKGQEVGAILVTSSAEHWGVARAYDIEIGFDLEPAKELSGYEGWAQYVNAHFAQCIYWV